MLEDMTEEVFIFAQCPKCFIFCEWNVGLCVCTFVCMFLFDSVECMTQHEEMFLYMVCGKIKFPSPISMKRETFQ